MLRTVERDYWDGEEEDEGGNQLQEKGRRRSDRGCVYTRGALPSPKLMRTNSISGTGRVGIWRWREKGVLCRVTALIFLVKYNTGSRGKDTGAWNLRREDKVRKSFEV